MKIQYLCIIAGMFTLHVMGFDWHAESLGEELTVSHDLGTTQKWSSRKEMITTALADQNIHPDNLLYHASDICSKLYTPLSDAVAHSDPNFVKLLIEHKADPARKVPAYNLAIKGVANERALIFEARDATTAWLLIMHKADVNAVDTMYHRRSLLSHVAEDEQCHEDVIDELVHAGVNVSYTDTRGWTPFHYMIELPLYTPDGIKRQIAKAKKLIKAGVPTHIPTGEGRWYGLTCAQRIAAELSLSQEEPFLKQMLPLLQAKEDPIEFEPSELEELAQEANGRNYNPADKQCSVMRALLPESITKLTVNVAIDQYGSSAIELDANCRARAECVRRSEWQKQQQQFEAEAKQVAAAVCDVIASKKSQEYSMEVSVWTTAQQPRSLFSLDSRPLYRRLQSSYCTTTP